MSYTRRTFLHQSATAISTLSLTGCMCSQLSQSDKPGLKCCDTPFLEPESLTVGEKTLTVDLAKAPSLSYVGSAANIAVWDKNIRIIVVHPEKDEYYALHSRCTHGYQTVSYNHQRGVIQCNNYNHSIFALNGDVVKGPAPSPLPTYTVSVENGILEIVL